MLGKRLYIGVDYDADLSNLPPLEDFYTLHDVSQEIYYSTASMDGHADGN